MRTRWLLIVALLLTLAANAGTLSGGKMGGAASSFVPICGNGTIEGAEVCDDGGTNGACPAACSATCTVNSCGGGWGPLTFSDSRFTGMTSGAGLPCSADHRSTSTDYSTVVCNSSNVVWSVVRGEQIDDILQWQATGTRTATITDAYFHTCGRINDHADSIQTWLVGGTLSFFLTRVTFNNASNLASCVLEGTGIRNGDDTQIAMLSMDHVYFYGNGQSLRSFTPGNSPYNGMHVALNNVCFEDASGTLAHIGPYGSGHITVDSYTNVFTGCSISGGNVVTGIPLACSALVNNSGTGESGGSVSGCPS